MARITVKINKRNLTGLINKTSFIYSRGTFTSYGFIAVYFETGKNNTAGFYEAVEASANSWTNYPGFKIWDNRSKDWKKADVLERCEKNLIEYIEEMRIDYPEINFELIGFEEE